MNQHLFRCAFVLLVVCWSGHNEAFAGSADWQALNDAGRGAWEKGQYTEAESMFESSLSILEKSASENQHMGGVMEELAGVYFQDKKYPQAEALCQSAMAKLKNECVPSSLLDLLANCYMKDDNYIAAAPLYEQALGFEIAHDPPVPPSPVVASEMNRLADAYEGQKRYSEAVRLRMRYFEVCKQMPWDKKNLAIARDKYADLLRRVGRDQEAKDLEEGAPSPK